MPLKNYLFLILILILSCIVLSCLKNDKQNKLKIITSPASENSSLPYLFSNDKTTLLSWVEKVNDSVTRLRYSKLKEEQWQAPKDISYGSDWFVNWADFPAIVENNGHLFSHVLKKSSSETFSYDVKLNLKPSNALRWKTNLPLHSDSTFTEHGFVSVLPFRSNTFFVTWLDGRNTLEKDEGIRGAMSLRAAEVSAKGDITNEALLDSRTCDCCQTTAVITENGPAVLYRDRTENEVRDISIVRQVHGKWLAPTPVFSDDWKINGCPVNGPKADALENVLAVAWFTSAKNKPTVKIAFSNDNGTTFNTPILVPSLNTMGRVDLALIDKKNVLVSYMDAAHDKTHLKVVKVSATGQIGEPKSIATMSNSRKSGFPQMEKVGDTLVFVWTSISNDTTKVKSASVAIEAFNKIKFKS